MPSESTLPVDERFAALFLKWFCDEPVIGHDDDSVESVGMEELRSLLRLLDENGLRIVEVQHD